MVSDEFLNNMAAKYISKRMKTINSNYESLHSTKIPEMFFKYCDEIESCLEELIVLEPYYSFNGDAEQDMEKRSSEIPSRQAGR